MLLSAVVTTNLPPDICDHSAAIKAEIEAAVRVLKERVKSYTPSGEEWYPCETITPKRVWLGYTLAMHRGADLYQEGDLIAGLPVVIDRYASRSITVDAGWVSFEREVWNDVVDGYRTEHIDERACVNTTW